jgi:hypothetical protein
MTPAIAFTATRVRTGDVAAFQRRAVLEPLTGPAEDDDQIIEKSCAWSRRGVPGSWSWPTPATSTVRPSRRRRP